MKVSAWPAGKKGPNMIVGISIKKRDRDQYFAPSWKEVAIEMDGKTEIFHLRGGFWRTCNEIADNPNRAIRTWLLRHHPPIPWERNKPPQFELDPLGGGRFKLLP
ncbi:hypothetical protein [Halotalea alkalilenta]|uniref:hypothetical protein n=1 Tax=Halotalea alkalilenta TaxID=376489 RepID=UPI0012372628|nr:hypothetical protein [Halotalea alkalilenta]